MVLRSSDGIAKGQVDLEGVDQHVLKITTDNTDYNNDISNDMVIYRLY